MTRVSLNSSDPRCPTCGDDGSVAMCSVCAGDGVSLTGGPCICGGTRTATGELDGLRLECIRLRSLLASIRTARPLDDWHEGDGEVLWWKFPIAEPPYLGSPLDDDFPDYVTHWTPLVVPDEPNGATRDG